VAIKQNQLLACVFHPEFTDDLRFHSYFVDMARQRLSRCPEDGILRGGRLGS
jgi:hypothetical protein